MSRMLDNLSGKEFGIYEVVAFDHMKWNGTDHTHGMSYYQCKCKKCGQIILVSRAHLLFGKLITHHGCEAKKNANIV